MQMMMRVDMRVSIFIFNWNTNQKKESFLKQPTSILKEDLFQIRNKVLFGKMSMNTLLNYN